jgi:hypothetical protein
MISGITDAVNVADIQDPGEIIVPGTVYGFSNGYFQADMIEPGNAYWLRTFEAGDITINNMGMGNNSESNHMLRTQNLNEVLGFILNINATNPGGNLYRLQFGFTNSTTDGDDQGYCSNPDFSTFEPCVEGGYSWLGDQAAPPAPPPPAFDTALKWELQRWYSQLVDGGPENAGVEHEFGIEFAYDSTETITLSWNNSGWDSLLTSAVLQDAFGGAMINVDMLSETSLTVDNPAFTQLKLFVTPSATGLGNMLALDEENNSLPDDFGLDQAYPNPFNPSTEIVYSVSEGGRVDLIIYDILGRRINTLASGYHEPNRYRAVWKGTDENGFQVPAGVYFYRMNTESFSDVKKIILLK